MRGYQGSRILTKLSSVRGSQGVSFGWGSRVVDSVEGGEGRVQVGGPDVRGGVPTPNAPNRLGVSVTGRPAGDPRPGAGDR